jgi:uncharacterized membrane protein HdeD (DUF308 family)
MNHSQPPLNKPYIIIVSLLIFVLPAVAYGIQQLITPAPFSVAECGKWFLFFASGWRLLLAGIRQITKPAFTAEHIFHLKSSESYPVIRELGFANLCAGIVAIIALFLPGWRIVSAFSSGLYYLLAGIMHAVRKPDGVNEKFAMYTDFIIFLLLAVFFYYSITQPGA